MCCAANLSTARADANIISLKMFCDVSRRSYLYKYNVDRLIGGSGKRTTAKLMPVNHLSALEKWYFNTNTQQNGCLCVYTHTHYTYHYSSKSQSKSQRSPCVWLKMNRSADNCYSIISELYTPNWETLTITPSHYFKYHICQPYLLFGSRFV